MNPSQFDRLTKTLTRNTSRRQAIKGLVAAAVGGTLGMGAVEMAIAAQLSQLNVRIVTGSDDLRSGSKAFAFVVIQNSTGQIQELSQELNHDSLTGQWLGWSNGSDHIVSFLLRITLPGIDSSGLTPTQIKEFGIRFFSGQSGPFDTGDNWNVNLLQVTLQSTQFQGDILRVSGSPFKRFVSDHDEWHRTFF